MEDLSSTKRGKGGEKEKGGGKENGRRYERNGGTYSRRVVVIGGNFIILRHYPRYCNAIKLDTLRTPRGSRPRRISRSPFSRESLSLPLPSAFFAKTPERGSPCCGLLHLALTTLLGIYTLSDLVRQNRKTYASQVSNFLLALGSLPIVTEYEVADVLRE